MTSKVTKRQNISLKLIKRIYSILKTEDKVNVKMLSEKTRLGKPVINNILLTLMYLDVIYKTRKPNSGGVVYYFIKHKEMNE